LKIATFNIWNKQVDWDLRIDAICEEINRVSPDIIALQEVKSFLEEENISNTAQQIANRIEYPFCVFREYPDSPDEGLAFLCKVPIVQVEAIWDTENDESNYCALRIVIEYGKTVYGITNVHLNWRSAEIRLKQTKAISKWISNSTNPIEILCGDFNDIPYSNIHRYLREGAWVDVAEYHEKTNNVMAKPTLDYKSNQYLKKQNSPIDQLRYDWIFVKEKENLLSNLRNVDVFANSPSISSRVFPSDHYGVLMQID
jgi:maltose 6'-phosphate phosphatase